MIGAWVANSGKTILGLSEAHLYSDAVVLFLGAIAFGIGTLIHHRTEK